MAIGPSAGRSTAPHPPACGRAGPLPARRRKGLRGRHASGVKAAARGSLHGTGPRCPDRSAMLSATIAVVGATARCWWPRMTALGEPVPLAVMAAMLLITLTIMGRRPLGFTPVILSGRSLPAGRSPTAPCRSAAAIGPARRRPRSMGASLQRVSAVCGSAVCAGSHKGPSCSLARRAAGCRQWLAAPRRGRLAGGTSPAAVPPTGGKSPSTWYDSKGSSLLF